MTNLINNREYRQNVLKGLIRDLHEGKNVEDVKQRFRETFAGVSSSEIAEVEQALIMEGMPVEEVQRLCDVHASVFRGAIEDIHKPARADNHPIALFKEENRAIEGLISDTIRPAVNSLEDGSLQAEADLQAGLAQLRQIDLHYQKKENILFPYLEKYGTTAPPKVMWGVDDEIRGLLKNVQKEIMDGNKHSYIPMLKEALGKIEEMIFKEENILLPMMLDMLTDDEWEQIARDSDAYGYCLLEGVPVENAEPVQQTVTSRSPRGDIEFPTGTMGLEELSGVLTTLPFDITFVDKDDTVKYFSQGKDRIFARTKSVIGRKVTNCHPPASVHIVEKIVEDLKSGRKENEDFWIKMGDRYVLIRYFAVRSAAGEYLGTLEVTQDIAPLQAIRGERRLLTD